MGKGFVNIFTSLFLMVNANIMLNCDNNLSEVS